MKNSRILLASSPFALALALNALFVFSPGRASAASQYWSGGGTWDNGTTPLWGSANGGPYTSVWTSGNDAVLEGTAGTITISSPTVQNITFNTTGYIFTNASTLTLSGTTPTLFLGSGISATIGNNTAAVLNGTVGLTKTGLGTLTLNSSAVSTFIGGLTINAGTFTGNFANLATPTDLINSGNALTLGGGTLSLTGKGSSATSQTFASTTVNSGGSVITLTQNGATSLTAALGAITRNSGGTLNVSVLPNATNIVTTSTANDGTGILGTWASVGATTTLQYAANNGSGTITNYTGATPTASPANLSDVTSAATNYSFGAAATAAGSISANTLRYTGAAATLNNNGNTLTLNGLMNAGSGALTITNGDLVIGANQELVIQANAQGTTINNRIVDNGGGASSLVYHGAGSTLTLNYGTNTYSGGTVINAGTVTTAALGVSPTPFFGTGPVTVNPGATFAPNRTQLTNSVTLNNATVTAGNSFGSTMSGPISLGGISAINVSGNLTISGNMTGSGGITKGLAATVPVTGTNNTYTGPTTISAGALKFKSSLYGNDTTKWIPANITVASNAALVLNVGGTGEFTIGQVGTLVAQIASGVNNNGLRAGSQIGVDTSGAGASAVTTYSAILADSTGPGGGPVGIKHFGVGTLELTGSNTYSGVSITDNDGTLKVSSLNSVNGGSPPLATSSLGRPTNISNGTIWLGTATTFKGGNLTYTGSGETTDRVINLGGGGNETYRLDQSGSGLLKFTGGFTTTDTRGPKTIVLQGSTNGMGEIAGAIINSSSATPTLALTKAGTSTWTISATNLYAGKTTISGGTLIVASSITNGGSAPTLTTTAGSTNVIASSTTGLSVGQRIFSSKIPTTATIFSIDSATQFTLNSGTGVTAGTAQLSAIGTPNGLGISPKDAANLLLGNGTSLKYTGGAASTDRGFTINGTSADHSATLDASGTGPINFTGTTSPAYGTAAQTRTLILSGTNTDANTLAANIGNNGAAAVSLTKDGSGKWILSGANTYTGPTTVSNGTLLVNGSLDAASTVTVQTNATLGGTGTINGSVTVADGGNLAPGASVGTLTNGNLDISALAAGTTGRLIYELGATNASDRLAVTGTLTIGTDVLGFSNFTFTALGGLQNGTYTLIASGAAISGTLDGAELTGTVGSGTGTLQISGSGTDIELVVSAIGGGASTNAFLTSLLLTPAGTLFPSFTSNVLSYTATNAYVNTPITVTVTNADLTATNTLITNGVSAGLLASGTPSTGIPLTLGVANLIQVRVVAQDGLTTNLYTVNVTLQPSLTPPTLTKSASGGVLSLSWPADHLGYTLEVKTNALNGGLNGGIWTPVTGSSSVTSTNLPISATTPTTFYRLVYP